jgi:ketosteroid isomerase-like protein
MVERHGHATTGVRNGDPTAFIEQLSTQDPVTLFSASQPSQVGWADVSQAIRRVASVYSSSTVVEFEVVAAGFTGDLAYLVGYERAASSIEGGATEELGLRRRRCTAARMASGIWCITESGVPRNGRHPATGTTGLSRDARDLMHHRR